MVKLVQRYQCPECEELYENEEEAVACCALPLMLTKPNIESLKVFAQSHITELARGDHRTDIGHDSYEAIGIFKWINARND
jgi:hypothetical protein